MSTTSLRETTQIWFSGGLLLIAFAIALRVISPGFGYDVPVEAFPMKTFIGGYMAAGAFYFWFLHQHLLKAGPRQSMGQSRLLLGWIILAGVIMRVSQFGGEAVLENDYYRYLWDGALAANGLNPYQFSPQSITDGFAGSAQVKALAEQGSDVVGRINHPHLKTVYPFIAQVFFALAYVIEPFSLDAWRLVLLGLEGGILMLILLMLKQLQKPAFFCAIYWWNPVAIKEVMNSAHMEPVLMVPLLLAVWFAIAKRYQLSSLPLAAAIGAKLWPIILVPVLYKSLLAKPRQLLAVGLIIAALVMAMFIPVLLAGLGETSGFVAYAKGWQASSALFQIIEAIAGWLKDALSLDDGAQPLIARFIIVTLLLSAIAVIFTKQQKGNAALTRAVFLITAALYLVSPTQYPWYFIWIAPFLALYPIRGFMLIAALIPLHYGYFVLFLEDARIWHKWASVWIMWVPVWLLLIYDWLRPSFKPDGAAHAS